jgi:homoserine O-succinyltransferase
MLILPKELPAVTALRHEGIAVYDDHAAVPFAGPVQPLNVALINLMPDKPTTEAQFARLLAAGDRPVRLILTLPDSYEPQNADPEHVRLFYRPWSTVKLHHLDGVIVTGAPLEHLPYQAVRYWSGLTDILDWLTARSVPSMHVCWAAMAALWHDHRVPKTMLAEKCFGVFPHVPLDHRSPPLRGVPLPLDMPVSRWAEVRLSDLPADGTVRALALSSVSGLGLAEDQTRRAIYLLNHPEYDADTLVREYTRDLARGISLRIPDQNQLERRSWDPTGRELFRNWLSRINISTSHNKIVKNKIPSIMTFQ